MTMFHLNNDARAATGHTTKSLNTYTPVEQMTIDEAIRPFRGRIFFRVYIKGKHHKYGIKISKTSDARRQL
jgi:hypothetical protein